jgi:AcrR family transcriptional regulator
MVSAQTVRLEPERYARRKIPRQGRSRSTVENIKQATLQLIAKEGVASLGTGRIAERAGISIGSLYQYFPTCEAILLALYEDVTASLTDATKRMLLDIMDVPRAEGIEYVIRSLLTLHKRNELVLIRLVEEKPELRFSAHPLSFGNLIRGSIRIYLQHQRPELASAQVERMAHFIEHISLSCIRWYLTDDHLRIGKEAFILDLSRMIVAYIDSQ